MTRQARLAAVGQDLEFILLLAAHLLCHLGGAGRRYDEGHKYAGQEKIGRFAVGGALVRFAYTSDIVNNLDRCRGGLCIGHGGGSK